VIVCEPKVCTETDLLLWVELFSKTVSKAVVSVTFVYINDAEGVQYATPAVAELFVAVGSLALVTDTPPAE